MGTVLRDEITAIIKDGYWKHDYGLADRILSLPVPGRIICDLSGDELIDRPATVLDHIETPWFVAVKEE